MNLRQRFASESKEFDREFAANSAPYVTSIFRTAETSESSGGNARASRVNRTHRVVQERAKTIAARRSKIRSLWLPLVIFSTLLVGICIAVWVVLDEYELAAAGTQVSSYQWLVPLFWSVPVSASLLAIVWFRQTRPDQSRGDTGRGSFE
jgi:hypothetical protein